MFSSSGPTSLPCYLELSLHGVNTKSSFSATALREYYAALKTAFYTQHARDGFQKSCDLTEHLEHLTIRSVALCTHEQQYYPLPFDIYVLTGKDVDSTDQFVGDQFLQTYLTSGSTHLAIKPAPLMGKPNLRLVYLQNGDHQLKKQGYIRWVGSEITKYRHWDSAKNTTIDIAPIQSKRIKLYLTTAYPYHKFGNVFKLTVKQAVIRWKDHQISPHCVFASSKSTSIPSNSTGVLPAGSVLYLNMQDLASAQRLARDLHGKSLCELDFESSETHESEIRYARQRGFGIVHVGNRYAHE